jgi:hypothetical protein
MRVLVEVQPLHRTRPGLLVEASRPRLGELIDPTEQPGFLALLDGWRAGIASFAVPADECELATCHLLAGQAHSARGVSTACFIVGRRHLEHALPEYVDDFNAERPHRALKLMPP